MNSSGNLGLDFREPQKLFLKGNQTMKRQAFTLIELLVVIAIIAILIAILLRH